MWNEGAIQIPTKEGKTMVHYWAKVYDKGSRYGIEGGRISKLTLKENGRSSTTTTEGLMFRRRAKPLRWHLKF